MEQVILWGGGGIQEEPEEKTGKHAYVMAHFDKPEPPQAGAFGPSPSP